MEYLQYMIVKFGNDFTKSVLNLIINGIPSIRKHGKFWELRFGVLNLIINGIPSILY